MSGRKNDTQIREFATWLVANITPVEQDMVATAFRLRKKHEWAIWSLMAENHAADFTRYTGGRISLRRRSEYEATGDTVAAMFDAGDLKFDTAPETGANPVKEQPAISS